MSDLGPLRTLTGLTNLLYLGAVSVGPGAATTLTGLTALMLDECKSVSDLEPLRTLTGLDRLSLIACKSVSDLEPLRTLTGLTYLDLDGCELVSDLSPLLDLSKIAGPRLIRNGSVFARPFAGTRPMPPQ